MAYKVLYRRYRPNDFENVVGQNNIIKTLKNSVSTGNISHAYIFSGPRGTGKTSTAKVFSKAINCLEPVNGSPCNKCENCININENPDIIEIDAASNNGVDQVRELIDNVKLSPSNCKYKVYIIDEVHMLTISAFNALLLTLEEPPKHAVFIFATTNIENVPITILSRCQRYDFNKISVQNIVDRMKEICKIENIIIDEDALKEIALIAEGGMRDALSILDQLSKENDSITLNKVEEQMRSISTNNIKKLIDAIENNDIDEILNFMNMLKNNATDFKTFIKKVIMVCSNNAKNIKLNGKRNRLNYDDYQKIIIELIESLNNVNLNIDSYLVVELIFLKYVNTDNLNSPIKEVNNESKQKIITDNKLSITENKSIKTVNDEFVKIRINNCFVNAKRELLTLLQNNFSQLLNDSKVSKDILSLIIDSNPVASSDSHAIFEVNNEHIADNINEIVEDIEKIYNKNFNTELKFVFIDKNTWLKEKEEYIKSLKKGVTYCYIEEKKEYKSLKDNQKIISDLFDVNKIEIV